MEIFLGNILDPKEGNNFELEWKLIKARHWESMRKRYGDKPWTFDRFEL